MLIQENRYKICSPAVAREGFALYLKYERIPVMRKGNMIFMFDRRDGYLVF